jgi:hypothetical protein
MRTSSSICSLIHSAVHVILCICCELYCGFHGAVLESPASIRKSSNVRKLPGFE